MMDENSGQGIGFEIDIIKLLLAIWKKLWLVIICAAIGAGGMYYYTEYYVTPLYSSSVSVYINSNRNYDYTIEDGESGINNISLARSLISTYITIIKSERVLKEVSEHLGGEYSIARLNEMISASQVNGTEVFKITVSSDNPAEAARVANMVADVGPQIVASMLEGSAAYVIDYATVPTESYYPNYVKSALTGGLVGALAAIAFILLLFMLDVRIKDEDELASLFDYPVIGRIPDFNQIGRGAYRKHGDYYGYADAGESYAAAAPAAAETSTGISPAAVYTSTPEEGGVS